MHHIEKGNPRDSKRYAIRGLTNKGGEGGGKRIGGTHYYYYYYSGGTEVCV